MAGPLAILAQGSEFVGHRGRDYNRAMENSDDYAVMAAYYDECYASRPELQDLEFWLAMADEIGGPILEIACGTGRVALELARRGHDVHGLELSRAMIEILERKLADSEFASRVSITRGDMRDFDLGQRFPLVLIPFRPFQHMYTAEDQLSAFACAKRHLAPGGRLVFDVFHPNYASLIAGVGVEHQDTEWTPVGEPHLLRKRFFVKEGVNTARNLMTGHMLFRTYDQDRLVKEESARLQMCWFSHIQLQLLFRLAGLEVVEEFGSFTRAPFGEDSKEMIFVLAAE